jgi:hypothetical protein
MFTSVLRSNIRGVTRHGAEKTPFRLLLRNRRVYRGTAYELPEQICYNTILYYIILYYIMLIYYFYLALPYYFGLEIIIL